MKTEEQTEEGDELQSDRHLTFSRPEKHIGRVASHTNLVQESSFLTTKQLRKVGSFHPNFPSTKLSVDGIPTMKSSGWDVEFKLDIEGNDEPGEITKEEEVMSRESVKSKDRDYVKETIIRIPDFEQ